MTVTIISFELDDESYVQCECPKSLEELFNNAGLQDSIALKQNLQYNSVWGDKTLKPLFDEIEECFYGFWIDSWKSAELTQNFNKSSLEQPKPIEW